MSSIRPLATITVLAAAGIFLYLKISETEPVLPPELGSIEFDQGLEFGTQFDVGQNVAGEATVAPGGAAPAFTPSAPVESAPAFDPSAQATSGEAPAFNPTVTEAPPADTSSTAPPFVPAPVVAETVSEPTTSEIPDLPPMPAVPPVAESVETQAAAEPETTSAVAAPVAVDSTAPPEITPTEDLPPAATVPPVAETTAPPAADQGALFAATRSAVEAALDRGQLSQALLLLSDWYGDPSLSPQETQEVEQLLGQLAGSVIYSTEHRLEAPYRVQAGESLQDIAAQYQVPWQLLAKINGIQNPEQLQAGQELKVVRGPFSATIDLSKRECTLMLNRRYAGKFAIDLDPTVAVEEGHWSVNQKLVTPSNVNQAPTSPVTPTEDHSLILSNTGGETNQLVIIRGSNVAAGATAGPVGRVIRLSSADVEDVFDILSLGSEVTIRR